jgi:hypothetical protein
MVSVVSFSAKTGSTEDSPFESPKEPLDFVALLLEGAIVLPRFDAVARRQGEGYGRSSIRGNQMNLGVPSAA